MNFPGFCPHVPELLFPLESVYLNMKKYTSLPVQRFLKLYVPLRVGKLNWGTVCIGPLRLELSVQATGSWITAQPTAFTLHLSGDCGQRSTFAKTPSLSRSAQPKALTTSPDGVPSHWSSKSFTPSPSVSRCSAAQPDSLMSVALIGVCGQRSRIEPVPLTSFTPSLSSSSSSLRS